MTSGYPQDWAAQVEAWGNPPAEHVGNVSARDVAGKSLADLADFAAAWRFRRHALIRERGGGLAYARWADYSIWRGKSVLDFGCGLGLEALQFAEAGAFVILADINPWNLIASSRMLNAHYCPGTSIVPVSYERPYFEPPLNPNLFFAAGVLHHIPWARDIIKRAIEFACDPFEIRAMLYTDEAWRWATGAEAPVIASAIPLHDLWPTFVRTMDAVGYWTRFYTPAMVESEWGDLVEIVSWEPLDREGRQAGVVMKPRIAAP